MPGKFPQSRFAPTANLLGGKCYYLAGNHADARSLLGKALAAGGQSAPEAAHWLARSLLKDGKPAEALAAVEKGLAAAGRTPQTPQLMMDRADAVYDIPARRGEAAALYAALAAAYPHDPVAPQALYMAGFAALGQADYQTALKHARAFLAAYPGNDLTADVMHVAAESSIQLGQFDEADKLLEQLLKDYPNHADAEAWKVRRGLTLFLQKKYPQTVAALQPLLAELHAAGRPGRGPLPHRQQPGRAGAICRSGPIARSLAGRAGQLAAGRRYAVGPGQCPAAAEQVGTGPRRAGQADCRFSRQPTVGPGALPAG